MDTNPGYSIFVFIVMMLTSVQGIAQYDAVPLPGHVLETLPNTDGHGLWQKPPLPSRQESKKIHNQGQLACQMGCVTPAGQLLGAVDDVRAFSNCNSMCVGSEFSYLNLKNRVVSIYKADPRDEDQYYIGLTYQCVEYARRWWMKNEGITFGDIESAYEIMYLEEGKDIYTRRNFPLARSVNGSARRAPQRGDLLIYYPNKDDPKLQYGHVAVIVDVDLEKGVISLAEQNYNNLAWEQPEKYARQIRLYATGGRYKVIDTGSSADNSSGGIIAGWVYPASKL